MNLSRFVGGDAAQSETKTGPNLGVDPAHSHRTAVDRVPRSSTEKGAKEFDPLTTTSYEFAQLHRGSRARQADVPRGQAVIRRRGRRMHGTSTVDHATETGTTTNTSDCTETFRSLIPRWRRLITVSFGAGFDFYVRWAV
jgi:hypothetical protein